MTNRPTTNILIALANILKNKQITMPTVYTPSNKNRITSVGDLLEYYVKDSFCNKAFEAKKTEEKLEAYRTAFSYLGNSNNPPDFIIRHGPAVEVKKIGNESNGNIALNSSFPKDYLYSTDKRISSACVKCENDFNGWTKKDMIYAIGNVKNDHLNSLWLIYGDCYAADKKIYERISDTIKDGVTEIENVDFGDTKELGRVNRVDPLGITYLRIRGMWGISHPSELYNSYIKKENNKTNIYVMMKKETYENMYDKPDFNEFLSNNILTKELLMVPDPNNPIAKIEVILFMAAF